jgi:hypothetical protein
MIKRRTAGRAAALAPTALWLALTPLLPGCVATAPPEQAAERCAMWRSRLAQAPDNPKLQEIVARCDQTQGGASAPVPKGGARAQAIAAKCGRIRALLAQSPDNPKLQKFAARCDELQGGAPAPSPSAAAAPAAPPSAPSASPATAAAPAADSSSAAPAPAAPAPAAPPPPLTRAQQREIDAELAP